MRLLGEERFESVEYKYIQSHIPYLKDITSQELKYAVSRVKESTPVNHYKEPNLSLFDNYIDNVELESIKKLAKKKLVNIFKHATRRVQRSQRGEMSIVQKPGTQE